MRVVDIDALDAAMYRKSFEVDDGRQKWNSGLWIRYKIFEEASREAPTVDAIPIDFINNHIIYLKMRIAEYCYPHDSDPFINELLVLEHLIRMWKVENEKNEKR